MYRYGGDGSEEDLLRFVMNEYREVHAEDVPPPPSLLSDVKEKVLDFVDEHWTPVCFWLVTGILTAAWVITEVLQNCRACAGQQEESLLRWRHHASRAALVHPARRVASATVKATGGPKDAQGLILAAVVSVQCSSECKVVACGRRRCLI